MLRKDQIIVGGYVIYRDLDVLTRAGLRMTGPVVDVTDRAVVVPPPHRASRRPWLLDRTSVVATFPDLAAATAAFTHAMEVHDANSAMVDAAMVEFERRSGHLLHRRAKFAAARAYRAAVRARNALAIAAVVAAQSEGSEL